MSNTCGETRIITLQKTDDVWKCKTCHESLTGDPRDYSRHESLFKYFHILMSGQFKKDELSRVIQKIFDVIRWSRLLSNVMSSRDPQSLTENIDSALNHLYFSNAIVKTRNAQKHRYVSFHSDNREWWHERNEIDSRSRDFFRLQDVTSVGLTDIVYDIAVC